MAFSQFEVIPDQDAPLETLHVNFTHPKIHGVLRTFKIMDGDQHITVMPSLNISGYGGTEDEARTMLKDSLDDYMVELFKHSRERILRELKSLGWIQNKRHQKRFQNNAYVDKKGILKNFNLPAETPIVEETIQV